MHLSEVLQVADLVTTSELTNSRSLITDSDPLPDWLMGAFRRRTISFADGTSDTDTRVFWLQSRGLTIDLRLPLLEHQQAIPVPNLDQPQTLSATADLEAWYAHSVWRQEQGKQLLSWQDGDSYQLHNRWPEPAELCRVGNCMMEFAPSGAYVEDWRLLNTKAGPLIGLELISETQLDSGESRTRQGALIICGEYAGLVLGRTTALADKPGTLKTRLLVERVDEKVDEQATIEDRQQLLDFQTLIGLGSLESGYQVTHSLKYRQMGDPLIALDGFQQGETPLELIQTLDSEQGPLERRWRIDTWEPEFNFALETAVTDPVIQQWRTQEAGTLERYTRVVS